MKLLTTLLLFAYLSTSAQSGTISSTIFEKEDLVSLLEGKEFDNQVEVLGTAYQQIGQRHRVKGSIKLALENQLKALKLYEEANNKRGIAQTYSEIAQIYWDQKDKAQTIYYYDKAKKIAEKYELKKELATIYKRLGCVFLYNKEFKKALHEYQQSLKLVEENNFLDIKARLYNNIGLIYKYSIEYEKSLGYLFKGIETNKIQGDQEVDALLLNNIGIVYFKMGNNKDAKYYLEQGLEKAIESQAIIRIMESHEALYALHQSEGQFEQALQELRAHMVLKDSLINANNIQKMTKLIGEYEDNKKEQTIALLNNEKKFDLFLKYVTLGGLVAVITIAGIIIKGQRYRLRKNKELLTYKNKECELKETLVTSSLENEKLAQKALNIKNQQLSTHAIQIAQKQQLLEDTRKQLKSIAQKPTAKNINILIAQINQRLTDDDEWKHINETLEHTNAGFFSKLQTMSTSLTPYELKVCMLAKLNFTIKDMAAFLKKEPNSIGIARHRIRKKLNLSSEENFNRYMINMDIAS